MHPEATREFATLHDTAMRRCVETLLDVRMDDQTWDVGSLPLSLGGLGLRSAVRGRSAAYWSSWADGLHMIRKRHALVADLIIRELSSDQPAHHLAGVVRARNRLEDVGFQRPKLGSVGWWSPPWGELSGRRWARHAPAWVAVQGNAERGRLLHVHLHLAPPPGRFEGTAPFSKWSDFWRSLHLLSYLFSQQVWFPGRLAPWPSVAPSSSSSRSCRCGRLFDWPPVGGRCRRVAAVPWGPDCSRHDSRFCLAQGWDASSSMCNRGWSRTGSCPTPQRTQVPWIGRTARPC